jgi:hypothetical protein
VHHPVADALAVAAATAPAGDHQDLIGAAVGGDVAVGAEQQPQAESRQERPLQASQA